jgi:hypothetical protein
MSLSFRDCFKCERFCFYCIYFQKCSEMFADFVFQRTAMAHPVHDALPYFDVWLISCQAPYLQLGPQISKVGQIPPGISHRAQNALAAVLWA